MECLSLDHSMGFPARGKTGDDQTCELYWLGEWHQGQNGQVVTSRGYRYIYR